MWIRSQVCHILAEKTIKEEGEEEEEGEGTTQSQGAHLKCNPQIPSISIRYILPHLARTLLYAVQCPIQNCQILALMDAGFFHDSVRIRIGPTLLDPSPSAIPIGHVQAQDLSA